MSDVSKTNEALLAKVMDTLAYYQCRANNPKADHPIQGYHAFSEDQRNHLREKQREGAEEIVRMFAPARVPVQGELGRVQHCWKDGDSGLETWCGVIETPHSPETVEEARAPVCATCHRLTLHHWSDSVKMLETKVTELTARAVQGELNDDDGNVLLTIIGNHQPRLDQTAVYEGRCNCGANTSDHELHLMRVILEASFSRTAVPDAATEGSDVCNHAITYDGSRWICRRCEATPRSEFERDAALAAVERVRATALPATIGNEDPHNDWNVGRDHLAKNILAALDGAPEPEWEGCDCHPTEMVHLQAAYDELRAEHQELRKRHREGVKSLCAECLDNLAMDEFGLPVEEESRDA